MGVFNWGAKDGESVVTPFFWYFLIAAASLTAITVITWMVVTKRKPKIHDEEEDPADEPDEMESSRGIFARILQPMKWVHTRKHD